MMNVRPVGLKSLDAKEIESLINVMSLCIKLVRDSIAC